MSKYGTCYTIRVKKIWHEEHEFLIYSVEY